MKLLLLESQGQWAAALRRLLSADVPRLCETRTMDDCEAELAAAPTSFVAAELTAAGASRLIDQFVVWRRVRPQAALAILAARSLTRWRELALEAGATLVVFSPRQLSDLVAALHRHAARHPQPPGNVAERIWENLPLGAK